MSIVVISTQSRLLPVLTFFAVGNASGAEVEDPDYVVVVVSSIAVTDVA
jgi:hypothetical protein